MRRPQLFRAIYRELRSSLGPEVPGGDLVSIAYAIIQAYIEDRREPDEFGRPRPSRALLYLPVDEAMKDGGWLILKFENELLSCLEFENEHLSALNDRNQMALSLVRPFLDYHLGPEWRHPVLTRFPPLLDPDAGPK